jgi:DNA-binding transcriptional LysR family regulator
VYDPVTLDQLRAFVAVVEEGSFSAAARKLKRVQSAISTSMANLENHLGVPIWDRATKVAKLTPQGQSVLASARRVLADVDALKRLASGMVMGIEASVSLCLDALFPIDVLLDLCKAFTKQFPAVDLRIDTQVLSGVTEQVMSGRATLGVAGASILGIAPGLERHVLAPIRMLPVAGPKHPLAAVKGKVPKALIDDAIQIVLSERNDSGSPDHGVISPRTWRVADLQTKHALVRAGLGWGNLPEHVVRADLKAHRLVVLRPDAWAEEDVAVHLCAIHRSDRVFGPAHRWLLEQLTNVCASHLGNR